MLETMQDVLKNLQEKFKMAKASENCGASSCLVDGLTISTPVQEALITGNLMLENVPADGHCQYHAIISQIKAIEGLEKFRSLTVEKLRDLVANWLQSHPELFPCISSCDATDWDTYVRYVRTGLRDDNSVQWGDSITLTAMATILGVKIHVWSPFPFSSENHSDQYWAVISPLEASAASQPVSEIEFRLMHKEEQHYLSISFFFNLLYIQRCQHLLNIIFFIL